MGRPRKFEESRTVGLATAVFCRRGYASTSVDDLVRVTGVHRGSLYGFFGSKHGLFLSVIDAVDTVDASPVERLDVSLVGLLELAPTDPRVRERIARLLEAHEITERQLADRLLARAGLKAEKESP